MGRVICRPLSPCSLLFFQTSPSAMPQRSTREILKTLVDSDRHYEYVDSSDDDCGGSVETQDYTDTPTACSIDLLHNTNPAACTPSPPQQRPVSPHPPAPSVCYSTAREGPVVPRLQPAVQPRPVVYGPIPTPNRDAAPWTAPWLAPWTYNHVDIWSAEYVTRRRIEELERWAEREEDQRLLAAGDYAAFWRRMRGREGAGPN